MAVWKKCASWQYLFSHIWHLLRWGNCCCGEWSVQRTEIHRNGHSLKSGIPSGGIHRRDTLEKDVCEGRESTISPNLAEPLPRPGWVVLLGQTNHHPATVSRDAHMAQWQRGHFLPPVNTPSTLESFQETRRFIWEGKNWRAFSAQPYCYTTLQGLGEDIFRCQGVCLLCAQHEEWVKTAPASATRQVGSLWAGVLTSQPCCTTPPPPRSPNHCCFLADCVQLLLRLGSCKLKMPLYLCSKSLLYWQEACWRDGWTVVGELTALFHRLPSYI